MNTGRPHRSRPDRDHEKDIAFLASVRTLPAAELSKLRRHYKKTAWRVAVIDRELARRGIPRDTGVAGAKQGRKR